VAAGRKPPSRATDRSRPTRGKTYPGQIRIIGGIWRGRRLPVPHAEGLRPTPDRVRETVFNWLAPYIAGARCIDLFAGTGALCLEALSRGASQAVMVERSATVARQLRQIIAGLGANATVTEADAIGFLDSWGRGSDPRPFDLVFVDPPFASDLIGPCAAKIETQNLLRPGGWVYIEAPSRLAPLPLPPTWELVRSRTAGEVGYHLARRPLTL